jgi:hypothetical protein
MSTARAFLAVFAFLGALAVSGIAHATPDFPPFVDQYLMLSDGGTLEAKVDPPDGCHLCHVNGSQGGTPLTAFGTLMQNNGAVPYEAESTAGPALQALESEAPRAVADIEKGIDPNADPNALTNDPVPGYGCSTASRGPPTGAAGIVLFGAFALAFRLARRNRAFRFDRR